MAIHYTGGKGGSGVYQQIINLMPPHKIYVEAFLGNGSILRYKKPADQNIGIEIDPQTIAECWKDFEMPNFEIVRGCAVEFLLSLTSLKTAPGDVLIYCDPPYLQSVRRTNRQLYRCDMMSEKEHIEFLSACKVLNAVKDFNIIISGYDCELYNSQLAGWRKVSFPGVSRGGGTIETVWLNFPEPAELHDYTFFGANYRKREDFKRQKARWIEKFKNMEAQKRLALFAALDEFRNGSDTGENEVAANNGENSGIVEPKL
jgi:hypothetical protein